MEISLLSLGIIPIRHDHFVSFVADVANWYKGFCSDGTSFYFIMQRGVYSCLMICSFR